MKKTAVRSVFSSILSTPCKSIARCGSESSAKDESAFWISGGSRLVKRTLNSDRIEEFVILPVPQRIARSVVSSDHDLHITCSSTPSPDIRISRLSSGDLLLKLEDHDGEVSAVCITDDGKFLLSCGTDRNLFVFGISDGSIAGSCPIPTQPPVACVCSGGFVKDVKRRPTSTYLFGCCGGTSVCLIFFKPGGGRPETISCSSKTVREYTCCTFSGDDLIVGSASGDISSFCVKTRTAVVTTTIPGSGGIVCLSDSSTFLLAGCKDGSMCQIDPSNLSLVKRIKICTSPITCLDCRSDGLILIGTANGLVAQHDLKSEAVTPLGRFPTCAVDSLVPLQDGRFLSVSAAGLTSFPNGEVISSSPATCAAVSDLIVLAGDPSHVSGIDPKTKRVVWKFALNEPTNLALTRTSKTCIVTNLEGELRVYDLRNREMRLRLKEHSSRISSLALFHDQSFALTCSRDRSLISYDLMAGRQVTCHRDPDTGFNTMALLPDDTNVYTGGNHRIFSWDLRVMDPVGFYPFPQVDICCLSQVDEYLIVGDSIGKVSLFDTRKIDPSSPQVCFTHAGEVTSLCVTNSGNIVSGGSDNTIGIVSFVPDPVPSITRMNSVELPKLFL